MAERSLPRARRRLLAGLAAAVVVLSGCGSSGDEVATEPAADVDRAFVQPAPAGSAALDDAPTRYGAGYWTAARLAKLEAAKARAAALPVAAGPAPRPTPPRLSSSPSPSPDTEPTTSPTPGATSRPTEAPSEQPTSAPTPEPGEEPTEEPTEEGPLVLTSWGCQWSDNDEGLRGAACTAEITEGDTSEWSCFELRPWGDPDGAEQTCSGRVAGADLAWTCTWTDAMRCALDDGSAGWSCMWGGSYGECASDDPDDGRQDEGWFCADLRDPSEGNWYVCDGVVNRDLPLSALALTGLWRLPD